MVRIVDGKIVEDDLESQTGTTNESVPNIPNNVQEFTNYEGDLFGHFS